MNILLKISIKPFIAAFISTNRCEYKNTDIKKEIKIFKGGKIGCGGRI
jgi:hypothetical protein